MGNMNGGSEGWEVGKKAPRFLAWELDGCCCFTENGSTGQNAGWREGKFAFRPDVLSFRASRTSRWTETAGCWTHLKEDGLLQKVGLMNQYWLRAWIKHAVAVTLTAKLKDGFGYSWPWEEAGWEE